MAEEIKKDEILSEDQLEQVAGGTEEQTEFSIDGLKKLGIISQFAEKHDEQLMVRAFALYGIDVKVGSGHFHKSHYIPRTGEFAGKDVGEVGALKIVERLKKVYGQDYYTD